MHQLKSQIPNGTPSVDTMHYYSAPSSPIRKIGSASFGYESETRNTNEDCNSNYDYFEFATVQDFCNGFELEEGKKGELVTDDERGESKRIQVERGDSLPTMAFADELFVNGLVKPLKLPPRLQYRDDMTCHSQTLSPTSVIKISFTRRNMWNDDFDPFMVALEKVKEEKKGRKSVHRRTRSHSPYRATSSQWTIDSARWDQVEDKKGEKEGPIANGLAESKGSTYARWAQRESTDKKRSSSLMESSSKSPINFKGLRFGRKVRPVKMDGPMKPTMKEGETVEESEGGSSGDTNKMQKVKGILLRYASFGKQNSEGKLTSQISALWKPTYFKRMSFKFKGNGHGSGKKKVTGESKMVIVPYRTTKLTLCLGYGSESRRV